jgi:serine phosphatase RsbU (regulator of sigma subunit)
MMGADLSFIFMPEEAGMVLHVKATYAHPGYAKTLLAKICKVWEPAGIPRGKGAIGVTYERGKPLLIGRYGSYPARIRELEKMIGSLLVYPLKSRGRMLGVLGLASAQESAFSEEHLNTVYGLANQAAVAIDNAELFERQRNIADTLQKSFLPAHAPDIPGFEFAARYRDALQEAEVGGDFYDAFQLRDGRFAVLVADVSGKGLSAAVNTAMGKYIIRAYASENPSPSSVLGRANRALERYLSIGMFITTFYGVLDPADGSFTYASAGHDPPMYYSFGKGYVSSLDVTGPGLGSIAEVEYGERMITFGPGDTLFMYTDGATDIRRRSQMLGWEGLLNLYNGAIGKSADEVAEYVFQGVLKYGDNHLSDDIAMIVLKRKV